HRCDLILVYTFDALLFYYYLLFFFFHIPATSDIYTLSLHDALPILASARAVTCGNYLAIGDIGSNQIRIFDQTGQVGSIVTSYPDRKSTRLNSSHVSISYAVFCLKKKTKIIQNICVNVESQKIIFKY